MINGLLTTGDNNLWPHDYYYKAIAPPAPPAMAGRFFTGNMCLGGTNAWVFQLVSGTEPIIIDSWKSYDASFSPKILRSWKFLAGLDFRYETPEVEPPPVLDTQGRFFSAYLNIGNYNVWTWDYYSRYGGGPPDEPPPPPPDPDIITAGRRKLKPCWAACGAFVFYTDSTGALYKFDGDNHYPIGLAGEAEYITHPLSVHRVPKIWRCTRASWSDYTETGHANEFLIRVLVADIVNIVGATPPGTGTTKLVGLIGWICGIPFYVANEIEIVAGVSYDLVMVNLGPVKTPCDHWGGSMVLNYLFYFPESAYQDFDYPAVGNQPHEYVYAAPPLPGGKYPIVFTPHNGVLGFAGFNDSTGAFQIELDTCGYESGRQDGVYEYVMTLVTKHGYESNWCGPASRSLQKIMAMVCMENRVSLLGPPFTVTGDYLKYSSDYIKAARIYRSYADRPGTWFLLEEIPYGYNVVNANWWWHGSGGTHQLHYSVICDAKGDEELGEVLHPWKLTPQRADSLATIKNTLCVADATGIYISEVGDPETFYHYQSFESEVVAVAAIPYFDEFLVFLRDKVYKTNIYDKSIQLLSSGIGLAGKDALCVLSDRVVFMAPGGGLYYYNGGVPQLIPGFEKLSPLMYGTTKKRNLNRVDFSNTWMLYSVKFHQVWVILGEGRSYGNLALLIHLDKPVFTLYKFPSDIQIVSGMAFPNLGDECVMLCDQNGNVYSFSEWGDDDAGRAIPLMIESPEMGSIDNELRMRRIYLEVLSQKADLDFRIYGSYDREAHEYEGVVHIDRNDRGMERHVNTFTKIVPTYQFKIYEESSAQYIIKRISLVLQQKAERQRPYR